MNTTARIDLYAEPCSGLTLRAHGDWLESPSGIKYYISGGIPSFLCYAPLETREVTNDLERLVNLSGTVGWENALVQVFGRASDMYRYTTDTARASFLNCLPLSKDATVLEVGCGLGQITTLLASRVGALFALDVVPQQAHFTLTRCLQQGLHNVHLALGGDNCCFPYRSGAFDAVVCNLVLEWSHLRERVLSADAAHCRFLNECFRVLGPGGVLYLNTKNRFSLRHILASGGTGDRWSLQHSQGRLWKICRAFADCDLSDGRVHSYGRLMGMLRTVGFRDIESYWAAPEMRYPTAMILTDRRSIRRARLELTTALTDTKATRVAMSLLPARLVKYFTPGITLLARRPYSGI